MHTNCVVIVLSILVGQLPYITDTVDICHTVVDSH